MSVYLFKEDEDVDSPKASTSNAQTPVYGTQALTEFWPGALDEIKQIQNMDVKQQILPLARIKKIMKLDDEVKMISAEAPVLFAKAAELFIRELTMRSWIHTEDNKRRTLQRNDIAMAISKYDQFDFLIDIVPRDEAKPTPTTSTPNNSRPPAQQDHVQYYFSVQPDKTPSPAPAPVSMPIQNNLQLVQQIVSPSGEIQHIPLTPQQMQMIRMQLNQGTQPMLIQGQQVVQVQGQQPVFVQQTQENIT